MTKIAQTLGVSKSTAMGTKMAVAFVNLFMAEIVTKMLNESRIKNHGMSIERTLIYS